MKTRGFTLIELLVVILIIAILAAFLYPVVARAIESGVQKGCMANLKQIGMALGKYYQNHMSYPPSPWDGATYNPDAGLVVVVKDDLPMICGDDERGNTDFVGNVAFGYAYDDPRRENDVPPNIEDRLLYNYWGYTPEGYEADATTYLPNNPPPGVANIGKMQFLRNNNAPKHTIVTHCTMHRLHDIEIILRLDGSTKAIPRAMHDEDLDVTRWENEGKWPTHPRD